jgi:hypothetical protein
MEPLATTQSAQALGDGNLIIQAVGNHIEINAGCQPYLVLIPAARRFRNGTIREPLEIALTFPAPVAMSGLVLMPRQNHREHEGDIREYSVQVSDNGSDWREVRRGELGSTFEPQEISFGRTVTTRYLKLVSLSGFGTDKMTALAELAVIYAGPKLDDQGNPSIEYQRNRTATPEIDEGVDKRAKPSPTPRP